MWPYQDSRDFSQYNLGVPINNILASVPGRIETAMEATRYGTLQLDHDLHGRGPAPPHLGEAIEHLRAIERDLISASNHYHEAIRNIQLR
jgi:hypothetical protein